MKRKLKYAVVGVLFVLPLATFAEENQTPAAKPVSTTSTHATSTNTTITLEGAKMENTAELVKLAKDAGATKASFNAKTNTMTVAGSKFNKEKFSSSLSSSLPGVSVKY